jgi:hypothetical protein
MTLCRRSCAVSMAMPAVTSPRSFPKNRITQPNALRIPRHCHQPRLPELSFLNSGALLFRRSFIGGTHPVVQAWKGPSSCYPNSFVHSIRLWLIRRCTACCRLFPSRIRPSRSEGRESFSKAIYPPGESAIGLHVSTRDILSLWNGNATSTSLSLRS